MDTCVHGGDGCIGLTLPPLALALGTDFGAVVIRIACSAAALRRRQKSASIRMPNVHSSPADHREDNFCKAFFAYFGECAWIKCDAGRFSLQSRFAYCYSGKCLACLI